GVAARDDDRIRVWWKIRPGDPRRNVVDDDLDRRGEALAVRELLTIVDHVHPEPDVAREPREVEADVPRADDVQLRRRLDRLDVHVHLPAADEPRFLREVVGELVVEQLRLARG